MNIYARACASLLSFLAAYPLAAQQFNAPAYYRVGQKSALTQQVVAADFNNDGNLDLAVSDENLGGVALLLGNGDGTFQPAKHLKILLPFALAVADLNGDGKADLLVQQGGEDGYLFVYLGKGDGTFQLKARYAIPAYPANVITADVNGDGHVDVIVASSNREQKPNGYVTVFFGNGDGTLTRKARYSAGASPVAIAAGDLNGDGFPDLVVANDNAYKPSNANTLYVLLNNGDGTFRSGPTYQTGSESLSVSIADLNKDGKQDLVVASATNQGIAVLLGNGDGTFADPVFYSVSSIGTAPQAIVVADFNHDGNLDVAVADFDENPAIFYGNGDGTFQPAQAIAANIGGTSLTTGDFNHDGAPDLAITSITGMLAVMINAQ